MGLLRIGKGVLKTIEGIVEGDVKKIAKGVGNVGVGVGTTLVGKDDDDTNIPVLDDDDD